MPHPVATTLSDHRTLVKEFFVSRRGQFWLVRLHLRT
jgi:hypothetical protein